MKNTLKYISAFTIIASIIFIGCDKQEDEFVSGTISPFISNFDLKKSFKETDLTLTSEVMKGASSIKGVVISDFAAGNTPKNLLVIQNSRIVGNGIDSVRGIAINIGADASKYSLGDSVHIKIEGGILKRVNGILQIQGVSGSAVTKVASNKPIKTQVVTISTILADPARYENTLVTIASALVEPEPAPGETFAGDKNISDGSGKAILHTEATANFATTPILISGNFTGIPFITTTGGNKQMQLWMRSINDFLFAVLPKLSPVIITGYHVDPNGTDGNYEYIQLLATRDIDFSATPFSIITTNNAGNSNPYPTNGWILGGARTYKINLTSGRVTKGEYFYVGGTTKLINGAGSTNISSSKWIASINYTTVAGADGVGAVTTNLLANSGNIAGISVFEGTAVDANTIPLDVIFYGGANGNFYSAGPPEVGYRITNTDYYNTNNPSTGAKQAFMGSGTNITRLGFPTAVSFVKLGGVYDASNGRWTTKRSITNVPLTATSAITLIEGGTTLVN